MDFFAARVGARYGGVGPSRGMAIPNAVGRVSAPLLRRLLGPGLKLGAQYRQPRFATPLALALRKITKSTGRYSRREIDSLPPPAWCGARTRPSSGCATRARRTAAQTSPPRGLALALVLATARSLRRRRTRRCCRRAYRPWPTGSRRPLRRRLPTRAPPGACSLQTWTRATRGTGEATSTSCSEWAIDRCRCLYIISHHIINHQVAKGEAGDNHSRARQTPSKATRVAATQRQDTGRARSTRSTATA